MRKLFFALALFVGISPAARAGSSGDGVLFNKPAQAVDFNYDMDASNVERFSIQVDYEDAAPSAATVSDGEFSSATLTVEDYTKLAAKMSSTTVTIAVGKNTSAALSGKSVTLNGTAFTEGINWTFSAVSSTITAKSLSDVIDAHHAFWTTVSSNVITVHAVSSGTYSNAWTVASSTPAALSVSSAVFDGGVDPGYLSIAGVTLTEGVDWTAATSSDTTANSIEDAINGNATLAALFIGSNTAMGKVTITSKLSGINAYPISISKIAGLSADYYVLNGGKASDVSVADNTFYEPSHGFSNGLALLLATTAGTAPTGLTAQTTYFAIPVDANHFKVSASSSATSAGAAVDITAVTGGGTFTFTPLAFLSSANDGIKWQASNDGTTFYDLTTTSVPYHADGGFVQSFTDYAAKYLRMKFTAPTSGGINLNAVGYWRKS